MKNNWCLAMNPSLRTDIENLKASKSSEDIIPCIFLFAYSWKSVNRLMLKNSIFFSFSHWNWAALNYLLYHSVSYSFWNIIFSLGKLFANGQWTIRWFLEELKQILYNQYSSRETLAPNFLFLCMCRYSYISCARRTKYIWAKKL